MVLQVIEGLVQWGTVVLASSNPLHEGLPVVSPSATPFDPSTEFIPSEVEGLRASLAQDRLRRTALSRQSGTPLVRLQLGDWRRAF